MEPSLQDAPCGFVSINDESCVLYANAKFIEMVGRSDAADVLGHRLEEFLSISAKIFFQTHFFPLLKLQGEVTEIFLTLRRGSSENLPVLVNAVRRQRDGAWVIDCVFVVVRERQKYEAELLAARRTAEEASRSNQDLNRVKSELERRTRELDRQVVQLEQRNRELRRISQILFHDLREPVRKLLCFTDLLMGEASTGASRDFSNRIQAAAQRVDRLLRAVQEYISIEPLKPSEIQELDLNSILQNAARAARDAFNTQIELDADNLPSVKGDERQLQLLFFHLLSNAVKFRRANVAPRVTVRSAVIKQNVFVALAGQYRYLEFAQLTFTDNSVGFEVNDPESAFQLLNKTSRNSGGLGVGLAMCRKVVENHSGTIVIHSPTGAGTKYVIHLPLEQDTFADSAFASAGVATSHKP